MHPDPPTGLLPALARFADAALDGSDIEPNLRVIADAGQRLTPMVDAAAAGWSEPGRAPVLAATDPTAEQLERIQFMLDEGPTVDAIRTGEVVLGGDTSWTRFGPRAGRAGLHSVLVLPVVLAPGAGWISLYGEARQAFDDTTKDLVQRFASSVLTQLANARLLIRANRTAEQAVRELADGAVIERAIGILMSRRGIPAEEALSRLRAMSQRGNVKLAFVATRLVDEAVSRARSRPLQD